MPPLGCQGSQHLDSGFQFATRCSKVKILTSGADVCYVLYPPENKSNMHNFSSEGLEANSPFDFHILTFSPVFCFLQLLSSSSQSSQYFIRWASSSCSSLCLCWWARIYLSYECFHHEKPGFPAFSWWKNSLGVYILTRYCFIHHASSNLKLLSHELLPNVTESTNRFWRVWTITHKCTYGQRFWLLENQA